MSKQSQQQFFDEEISKNTRQSVGKFYSITWAIHSFYREYLCAHVVGKRVLEYGCGSGSQAFFIGQQGAKKVVGIDISGERIKQAVRRAQEMKLENVTFRVMDAEAMDFEDGSFDVVCGSGILHHLNMDIALPEIARVLATNGRAIFIEPMGYNPAINLFRHLTPHYRVEDEHPLKKADIDLISRHFGYVDHRFYYLFTLLAVPFHRTLIHSSLVAFLNFVDQVLFKIIPGLKFLAWQVVLVVEKPLKHHA
ncbi:MAG: class I SAM-dependent methyltransferase [Anaerolineae bacterium]|nr:class I SAM-dependent methyltransferase [Anaerolineae bacterium]